MSAAPLTSDMGASPSIGDLLLRHGYVSQEKLDWAEGVHRETGEPIGQILVEDGALSRLELASALAEQWSATSSWMPAGAPVIVQGESSSDSGTGRVALPDDLLARVAAVEAAVQSRPTDATEVEVIALSHAIDDLLGRIGGVESSLKKAATRYEELVTAVDDAVCAHDARLDQLEARDTGSVIDQALSKRVDALDGQQRVGPVELDELRSSLVAQIDELATAPRVSPDAHEELRAQIEAVSGRIEGIAGGALATLGDTVARIDQDGTRHDELLTRLVGRIDSVVAALDQRSRVDDLATLAAKVEELAARPVADVEIEERLDQVATAASIRVEELVVLGNTVRELEDRLARAAESDELAELRAVVEGFVAASDTDGGVASAELAARVAGLTERLDQLAHRVDEAAASSDLHGAVEELASRLDAAADGDVVSQLRSRLEDIVAEAARQRESVDALTAVVGELSVLPRVEDDDLRALERTVRQIDERTAAVLLPDDLGGVASRLDAQEAEQRHVAVAVDELRARLGDLARDPAPDPALSELRALLEELGRRQEAHNTIEERLAVVENRLTQPDNADLAPVLERLEALEVAPPSEAAPFDASALSERLAALESRIGETTRGDANGALAERLSALEASVSDDAGAAELGELKARLDRIERMATSANHKPGSDETRLEAFEARFVELERAVASAATRPATGSGEGVSERELDYLRVAVEGVGMRLAEQQRALAPLLRAPDIGARMDALAARVGDLLGAGLAAVLPPEGELGHAVSGGAELLALASRLEGIESSVRSDREKLLVQIERLASSFDWRIRRIEDSTVADDGGEADA